MAHVLLREQPVVEVKRKTSRWARKGISKEEEEDLDLELLGPKNAHLRIHPLPKIVGGLLEEDAETKRLIASRFKMTPPHRTAQEFLKTGILRRVAKGFKENLVGFNVKSILLGLVEEDVPKVCLRGAANDLLALKSLEHKDLEVLGNFYQS